MMTRSMDRPDYPPPKARFVSIGKEGSLSKNTASPCLLSAGSQPPPRSEGTGGVSKRRASPTQRSVKLYCSKMSQEDCLAQLKQLLPTVSGEEEASITEVCRH